MQANVLRCWQYCEEGVKMIDMRFYDIKYSILAIVWLLEVTIGIVVFHFYLYET